MASSSKAGFQPDSDIHITYEDQQKINRFARLNARLEDAKEELKCKQNDLKNMEDAGDEIELLDDAEAKVIPYMFGEVFLMQDLEVTQKALEDAKNKVQSDIGDLEKTSAEIKETMSDLRTQLYAKFGNNINLEADEE